MQEIKHLLRSTAHSWERDPSMVCKYINVDLSSFSLSMIKSYSYGQGDNSMILLSAVTCPCSGRGCSGLLAFPFQDFLY